MGEGIVTWGAAVHKDNMNQGYYCYRLYAGCRGVLTANPCV